MTEDAGVDAWKAETSAFDRVRSVVETVSQPHSAAEIADEAAVAENTARDHLDRLVEMNVLLAHDHGGTTTYAPDPLHARAQALRDLLDDHDHDALVDLKADLQDRIEAWRDEYGVDSPDALRERAADTDAAAETRAVQQTARDWDLVAYRLDVVEDAIENYAAYSRDNAASA